MATILLWVAGIVFFFLDWSAYFLLSGKKLGYTFNNRNLHNVSLGQGQEIVAEQALDLAAAEGHWVILQVCVLFWFGRRGLLPAFKPSVIQTGETQEQISQSSAA